MRARRVRFLPGPRLSQLHMGVSWQTRTHCSKKRIKEPNNERHSVKALYCEIKLFAIITYK